MLHKYSGSYYSYVDAESKGQSPEDSWKHHSHAAHSGQLQSQVKLNVAPVAVFQMLKSMCAGQRMASEPQDSAAVSLHTTSVPERRGRNKDSTSLGRVPALLECSGRKGSSQRTPRQPSATRLPEWGGPGRRQQVRGST
nr:mitotic-spindle organizing protein 2B-like [Pan troglodytes]